MTYPPDSPYVHRLDGSDLFLGDFTKEVWNLALEQAARICDKYESYGAAYEIRQEKKK